MKSRTNAAVFAALIVLAAGAFCIIGDQGPARDTARGIRQGEANLVAFKGGPVSLEAVKSQTHGAFALMAGEVSGIVLHDRLKRLDPFSARRAASIPALFLFFWFFYLFVKRNWGTFTGILAVTLLLTCPPLFGFVLPDLNGCFLMIFFTLAAAFYADASLLGRRGRFYAFAACLGLGFCVQPQLLSVVPVLVIWEAFFPAPLPERRPVPLRHWILGAGVCAALVLIFYSPALWVLDNRLSILGAWLRREQHAFFTGRACDFEIFRQLAFRVPAPMLASAALGAAAAVWNARRRRQDALLLIWLLVPQLILCLPHFRHGGGFRHGLVALPVLAVLAASGVRTAAHAFVSQPGWKKQLGFTLSVVVLSWNIAGIYVTHPYENVYFNALAGGLGQAQAKHVPDACDEPHSSFKEIGAWLDVNASPNAQIYTLYGQGADFSADLRALLGRKDLRVGRLKTALKEGFPPNSYIVRIPCSVSKVEQPLLNAVNLMRPMYFIQRQSGVVATVYYTATPKAVEQRRPHVLGLNDGPLPAESQKRGK